MTKPAAAIIQGRMRRTNFFCGRASSAFAMRRPTVESILIEFGKLIAMASDRTRARQTGRTGQTLPTSEIGNSFNVLSLWEHAERCALRQIKDTVSAQCVQASVVAVS